MKKDRNTFFENSNMNMAFSGPAPQMMPQMMPMGAQAQAQASQSFYSNTGTPMMGMMPMNSSSYNDSAIGELESRMSKLERNINRLESRISKLEGSTYYSTDTSYDSNNNMYMV